jgi:ubiquinone/menaquinone biosynthesis C-methylase UbiE
VPPDWQYIGFDIGLEEVDRMRTQLEHAAALQASAYELPFPSDSFDLILACEVFEHLEDPPRALAEIERVLGNGMLLLSVPWEPAWRGLNVLRGAYLSELGNTPGHVQHFSRRAIRDLVASRFEVVAQRRPLPWTMLLARSR